MSKRSGTKGATHPVRRITAAACLCMMPLSLAAYEDVNLTINNGPATEEAQEEMTERLRGASLLVSLIGDEAATARDIVSAARSDYTSLVEALFSDGHYSTVVRIRLNGQDATEISPLGVPDEITRVDIIVDPGPQFRFGRADVAPLATGTEMPEGFATGRPAQAQLVRRAANGAVRGWQEIGYPKAAISGQTIQARHANATLDVAVAVDPGPRLRFGDTPVSGESRVKDARVRQIAGLPKGEYYSPDAVADASARLRRTGTFRSVRFVEGDAKPDGTLDMEIVVVDREPRRIGAGAEVSTDDGLTLTGFWLHRNILGGAESLRFDAEIRQLAGVESDPDYILTGRFERPAVYGPDTLFYGEAEISYEDEPDFVNRTVRLEAGFSRQVTDTLTVESGLSVSYSEVTDRFLEGEPTRELLYVSLPSSAEWDLRDDPLDATSGAYIRLQAEPFVETLNSDTGIKLDLDTRAYRSLDENNRFVLAGRAFLGTLIGPDPQDAPPDFLYYSGGGGVVRGQPYQSLDIDYGDVTLGGRSFAGVSGEVRFGVTDTLGGVVFADAGLLSGDSDWSDPVSHAGAGIGVRYKTPVGPLRFDVAGPVAGDTGDGVQIYIGIGQAF